MKRDKSRGKLKGFTIIELVVVVLIIAILASIAFVSYEKSRKQARDSRRVADLTNLADTLKMYYLRNGGFPATSAGISALVPDYYQTAPADPTAGNTYSYTAYDVATENPSVYVILKATLEDSGNSPSTNYSNSSVGCTGGTVFCLKVAP